MTYSDSDARPEKGATRKIAAGVASFTVLLLGMIGSIYLGTGCWPVM